jgi:hypothetical protein
MKKQIMIMMTRRVMNRMRVKMKMMNMRVK